MPAKLVHTGQVVVDLTMTLDALPPPGGDVFADSARFEVGGGFNVMAAARRSGMAVSYVGRHGTGPFGDLARQALRAEGIDFSAAVTPGCDTGFSVALTDASGERTFISHVGAEGGLGVDDLTRVALNPGDFVYVSGYSLVHAQKRRALEDWCPALPPGVELVFDPGPLAASDDARLAALMARVTLWSGNRREAEQASGSAEIPAAMGKLAERLAPSARVLVRDGAAGCWIGERGEAWRIPSFPVTAVDTNGAGDAHTGVFVAELGIGLTTAEAARRANAAAAMAVTRHGPATAPTRARIDRFLARFDA
jgi:sugar/nucleoside kinase (ribokinase family)